LNLAAIRTAFFVGVVAGSLAPACAAEHLTVLLGWFVNPNHGPLIVAQAIGAFAREGLDVEFVQPADPSMPPRLIAAGQGDIAIDYQPQLYQQVVQGLPLLRIGVLVDRPLETLETLDSSGIRGIADLKGRRIGYNNIGGDIDFAEIGQMLATARLSISDVTLVNVGTALSTSLLTHRVDAVGVNLNFEHFELIDKGAVPRDFDYTDYGVPAFDELIMVVRRDRASGPRMVRFLRAVREGASYIKADPDQAWASFVRLYPNDDNALNRAAWRVTTAYFAADPFALDRAKYEAFGSFLVAHHVIARYPPISSFCTQLLP
jgi:putative hydroxymethylpyrimidine transport system substrate-binding protein